MNENLAMEKEIARLEEMQINEENIQRQQESKTRELECCLRDIKKLRDELKETEIFRDFGYVLKKDLINVYLEQKKARSKQKASGSIKSIEESEEDVLLLI